MKTNKISWMVALVAGALIALSPTLRAADKAERPEGAPPRGPRVEAVKERLAKIAEELELTAEQKTKVEAAFKAQAEALRGAKDATPEERREKGQAARKEMQQAMKEILTPEQFAKFEKMRDERRPRGPGGPGGPEGRKPKGEKPAKD
jgi:periplasmic protein CpxP/Spy